MQCMLCSTDNPEQATFCQACSGPLGDTSPDARHLLPVGSLLKASLYTVGKPLGRGGFGITYLGSDVKNRRPVAIKEFFPDGATRSGTHVISPNYMAGDDYNRYIEQFLSEATLLSQFDHPSIVRVYEMFKENGTAYMVMDYHAAPNLSDLLEEGSLDELVAIRYSEQIGEALHALHEKGYLHRDVKPSNILVHTDGRAVLIDFGTAREYTAGKTRRMTMMLTPGYAPLEQYTERARRGPYTDIYSLAGTLYHMLTGELPVAATDRAVGIALPPARELNPMVSPRVSDAVQFGLNMEIGRRPQTAREFIAVLKAACEDREVAAVKQDERPTLRVDPPTSPAPEGFPIPEVEANMRLGGHVALIASVAVSSSSRWIASGGWDGSVRMWDSVSGKAVWMARLQTAMAWIWGVAFDPQERYLAAASEDRSLRLWDIKSGQPRHIIDQKSKVTAVAFSPDGKRIVSGSADHTVRIYDADTARQLLVLSEHYDTVWSIAFSPDGFLLASASEDRTVRLWEPSAGRQLYQLTPASNRAKAVCFSPDGQFLVAAFDNMVAIWETFTAKEVLRIEHPAQVSAVVFSPDGRHLASACDDHQVRIYNAASGQLKETLETHSGKVASVAWASGGELLVSGGSDRQVRVWRMRETLVPEVEVPQPAPSQLPPISSEVPVPRPKPTPPAAPTRERATIVFKGHWAPARAVTFTPDGESLVTASEDHTVRVWSVATGQEQHNFTASEGAVTCVSASRQGNLIASGSEDGLVKVWHLPDGAEVASFRTDSPIRTVALSSGGRLLAAGGDDTFVFVWDVKTGQMRDLRGHEEAITAMTFTPNDKYLLSASEDRTVLLWNGAKGELAGRVTGHTSQVWSVAVAPDGAAFFSASSDRSVRMWDLPNLKPLRKFNGHKAQVRALAIPLEGQWVASGGDDRTIRFWDVHTGQELHRIDLRSSVNCLACSPKGTHVAWTCFEPTARLLRIDKYVATPAGAPS